MILSIYYIPLKYIFNFGSQHFMYIATLMNLLLEKEYILSVISLL